MVNHKNLYFLILKMISLVPEEVVDCLKAEIRDSFSKLGETERLALVTAHCEGCVNHGRLKELTKEHPLDITMALQSLVEKKLLLSEGWGRNTFYYRPGHLPCGMNCSKLGVYVRSLTPNIWWGAPNIWIHCSRLRNRSDLYGMRRGRLSRRQSSSSATGGT